MNEAALLARVQRCRRLAKKSSDDRTIRALEDLADSYQRQVDGIQRQVDGIVRPLTPPRKM